MEAAQLGLFMISAGVFTTLVDAPNSWLGGVQRTPALGRALIGLAMGGTATALIYSPWGRRSGAHMNPAITITYLRLGKIPPWDAVFYIVFQFAGGLAGVLLVAWALGAPFTQPPVNWVATVPGPAGVAAAFAGELAISVLLMGVVLSVSSKRAIARFTGLVAGLLIWLFVEFEAPYSGFGMNPARTFASALPGGIWTALWIYFTAAPLGMLLAARGFIAIKGVDSIPCCKLHHDPKIPCIFCSGNRPRRPAEASGRGGHGGSSPPGHAAGKTLGE